MRIQSEAATQAAASKIWGYLKKEPSAEIIILKYKALVTFLSKEYIYLKQFLVSIFIF